MIRRFTLADQAAFAALSGDANPLHLDPALARRLLFGGLVVHGVHAVLWALDRALGQNPAGPPPTALATLTATFHRPVMVGDAVELTIGRTDSGLTATLCCEGVECAQVEASFGPGRSDRDLPPLPPVVCRDRGLAELAGASGHLDLGLDADRLAILFPAAAALPRVQIATILASTRLVGMEAPGLHSIFNSLRLTFPPDGLAEPSEAGPTLAYRVVSLHERFNRVSLQVSGPGCTGRLEASYRPAPRRQATFDDLRRLVRPGMFAGQRALIVGGSRGLGEVVAKLVACGGGSVRLTYNQGRAEADAIVAELTAAGADAAAFAWDVTGPDSGNLDRLGTFHPTHLYHFATPFIATRPSDRFRMEAYLLFSRFYVEGFDRLVRALAAHVLDGRTGRGEGDRPADGILRVFYPSTIFIDHPEPGMAEYAAAKAAGEALCGQLAAEDGRLRILSRRLPRLMTDQTVKLVGSGGDDPAPVLLEILGALDALPPAAGPQG